MALEKTYGHADFRPQKAPTKACYGRNFCDKPLQIKKKSFSIETFVMPDTLKSSSLCAFMGSRNVYDLSEIKSGYCRSF